ncbi:caspase family protein [Desulfovibrio inopinatus]|uniref:caspase family protein n=1 Tax=Desulfovibrio inopinatus TaxID=102109 RepID=UPI0003F86B5D|nr:caspase family protein [Desulfovibrio inopinatus]
MCRRPERQFLEHIQKNCGDFVPAWPIGQQIKLGDIVELVDEKRVNYLGSILDPLFGIGVDVQEGDSVDYMNWQKTTELTVGLDISVPLISNVGATLSIGFGSKGNFLFVLRDVVFQRIQNLVSVRREALRKISPEYFLGKSVFLVTEVARAGSYALAISNSSNARLEITSDADLQLGIEDLARVDIGLKVVSETDMAYTTIANTGGDILGKVEMIQGKPEARRELTLANPLFAHLGQRDFIYAIPKTLADKSETDSLFEFAPIGLGEIIEVVKTQKQIARKGAQSVALLRRQQNKIYEKQRRLALLVGINNYKREEDRLYGCVNDVVNIRNVLKTFYGFMNDDIRVLVDDRACNDDILHRLEWMVANAKPGDTCVFHFSGHGSQILERNDFDELEDGLDELICPWDIDWHKNIYITDDMLAAILSDLREDVHFEAILDCCHSQSGLKEMSLQPASELIPNTGSRSRFISPPVDIVSRFEGAELNLQTSHFKQIQTSESKPLLWAACQDWQTAADATISGSRNGAFTYFLCHHIRQSQTQISRNDLINRVRDSLLHNRFAQIPELECDQRYRDKPLFSR